MKSCKGQGPMRAQWGVERGKGVLKLMQFAWCEGGGLFAAFCLLGLRLVRNLASF